MTAIDHEASIEDTDIARCPGCGAWASWPTIAAWLHIETHPDQCPHLRANTSQEVAA